MRPILLKDMVSSTCGEAVTFWSYNSSDAIEVMVGTVSVRRSVVNRAKTARV